MKDCCYGRGECDESIIFKDVVIIGNGPSGIVLSYILCGNWPYYNGERHPDEMLLMRLRSTSCSKSLIEQDLQFLAMGLEGRSRNPVAVLVDSLNHPYDDQDFSSSTRGLLNWKHHSEKAIDHVVIGKGKPGGCWQDLAGNFTTISLSSWMELPQLSFNEWEYATNLNVQCPCKDSKPPKRVKIKQVAKYYRDYVEKMKLSKNFRNFSYVSSVKPISNFSSCDHILPADVSREAQLWLVEGYDNERKKSFAYVCRNVVLAVGTSDAHNILNVPGELTNPDWVYHDLKRFENAVIELKKKYHSDKIDPVLIVGSGLSAADAVLICNQFDLPTIHVFNSCMQLSDSKLPKNMYPEYHHVYSLMKNEEPIDNYTPLSQYIVVDICRSTKGKRVRLMSPDGFVSWYNVSLVVVMVGYRPELKFLPPEFENGTALGAEKKKPIHSRNNPIRISPWSYEVQNSPPGLFAMGPLVGDNVIRVIPGGALAIANHLFKQKFIQDSDKSPFD